MRWLRKLGQDLSEGRNLEVYLTIVISIALSILGVAGVVKPEYIATGTLATLALLALSTINNRDQMIVLQNHSDNLSKLVQESFSGKIRPKTFSSKRNQNTMLSFKEQKTYI